MHWNGNKKNIIENLHVEQYTTRSCPQTLLRCVEIKLSVAANKAIYLSSLFTI